MVLILIFIFIAIQSPIDRNYLLFAAWLIRPQQQHHHSLKKEEKKSEATHYKSGENEVGAH